MNSPYHLLDTEYSLLWIHDGKWVTQLPKEIKINCPRQEAKERCQSLLFQYPEN